MAICQQVEFYFSDGNLRHDKYLQSQMDSNGFVAIEALAQFPRIFSLNPNVDVVTQAIQDSQKLEVKGNLVRLRRGWQQYVDSEASQVKAT